MRGAEASPRYLSSLLLSNFPFARPDKVGSYYSPRAASMRASGVHGRTRGRSSR